MAESTAAIANLALGRLGLLGEIDDLDTDTSAEGEACRVVFAHCRDKVLAAHDWPFATKRALLALLFKVADITGSAYANLWLYAYALPVGCLKPRDLWPGCRNPAPEDEIDFELESYSSDTITEQTLLLCDVLTSSTTPVVLRYTARIENPVLYPPEFDEALAAELAAKVAGPLRKATPQEILGYETLAKRALDEGIAKLLNQQKPTPAPLPMSIRVRE